MDVRSVETFRAPNLTKFILVVLTCVVAGLGVVGLGDAAGYGSYIVITTLLAFAGIVVAIYIRPEQSLSIVLLWLPLVYLVKISQYYASGGTYVGPYLVNVAPTVGVLVAFGHCLVRRRVGLTVSFVHVDPVTLLTTALLLWSAIEILNPGVDLATALYGFKVFGVPILMYFIGSSSASQPDVLERNIKAARIVLFGALGYGLLQMLNGGTLQYEGDWIRAVAGESGAASRVLLGGTGQAVFYRVSSFFDTFAVFGAVIWLGVAYVMPFMTFAERWRSFVFLTISFVCLWGTLSRTSWVATIVILGGIGVLSFLRRGRRFRAIGLAVGLLSCLVFFRILFQSLPPEISSRIEELAPSEMFYGNNNFTGRDIPGRFAALDLRTLSVGRGAGVIERSRLSTKGSELAGDCGYYSLIFEYGIPGLLLFAGVIASTLRLALRVMMRSRNPRTVSVCVGMMSMCLGVLVAMLTTDLMFYSQVSIVIWFALGAFVTISRSREGEEQMALGSASAGI